MINPTQQARLAALGVKEWPYFLVGYLMSIMATYLTGVWEISITHASQIMNVYSGTVIILPVVMNKTIPDMRSLTFTVYVSKIAFVLGLVMLTISASGTCKEDEPLCISTTKKVLFYAALLVLAVAMSAHETWSEKYLNRTDQFLHVYFSTDRSALLFSILAFMLFPFGALTAIVGYVSPWWIKFLMPTISAALFFFQVPDFIIDDNYEDHDDGNYGYDADEECLSLFKACVCICSVLVSVVFAVGNTFFILQAIDLSPKLWFVTVPLVVLPIIKEVLTMNICPKSTKDFPLGLFTSMIFATLCCITAAKVETRRLGVVVSESVVDDPETIIPMTILWLVPQFVLLGLAEKSFDEYFENGLKEVMGNTRALSKIIRAAGCYGGVLSVYAVGKLKPTWIQDTLNTSQLDYYYWLLATISAVSLVCFVVVTVIRAIVAE